MMNRGELTKLFGYDVGYNIQKGLLMLRSLDSGDYAVSYNLESSKHGWEKEFFCDELEEAISFFLLEAAKV